MNRGGMFLVATRISEDERVALMERLVRDRTTMSRVLQVAIRAYVDRALPERYMREIVGYQKELARRRLEARMAKKAARALG
jgi:hypothetical protein